MPIGWTTTPNGKRRALDKIDEKIANLKKDRETVLMRAGEAAIGKHNARVDALREQHTLIQEKINLLTDLRRDLNDTSDYEW